MSTMTLIEPAALTLPSSPIGALRATRTRWWQRLLVAMLVVGLVGLPSATVHAAEKTSGADSAVAIAGQVAGGVSALSSAGTLLLGAGSPIIAALAPVMPYVAAVALAVALYGLLKCMFGKNKCSAATIAMAALSVGLAGANFAVQMDASSWFGTGEFMRLGTPRAELLPQQIAAAQAAGDTGRAANLTAELRTLQPNATVLNGPGPIVSQPLGPVGAPVYDFGGGEMAVNPATGQFYPDARLNPTFGSALNDGTGAQQIANAGRVTAGGEMYGPVAPTTAGAQPAQAGAGVRVAGPVTGPTVPSAGQPAQPPTRNTMDSIMQYVPLASLGLGLAGQVGALTGGSGSSGSGSSSADTRRAAEEQERRNREAAAAQEEANRRSALAQEEENKRIAKEIKDQQEAVAKAQAEELAKQKAEQEAVAKAQAEELAKQKAEQEAVAKAQAEELAKQKAEQEAVAKVQAEELAKQKAEQEAAAKARAEELAKQNAEWKAEQKRQETGTTGGGTSTGGVTTLSDPVTGEVVTRLELNQNVFKGGCEDGARARVGNTARPNVRYANTDATKAQYDTGFSAGMAGRACQ